MNLRPEKENPAGALNLFGTVLFNELARKIAASISRTSSEEETGRYLIRAVSGGGKSHFIQLLKQELTETASDLRIVPLIFDHDCFSASTEREICRAAARQAGFAGGGSSLDRLISLLRDNGEKAALLFENPRQIFGESYSDLMERIVHCGVSTVIMTDDAEEITGGEFREFNLPVFSNGDIVEMLKNRGSTDNINESAARLFSSF